MNMPGTNQRQQPFEGPLTGLNNQPSAIQPEPFVAALDIFDAEDVEARLCTSSCSEGFVIVKISEELNRKISQMHQALTSVNASRIETWEVIDYEAHFRVMRVDPRSFGATKGRVFVTANGFSFEGPSKGGPTGIRYWRTEPIPLCHLESTSGTIVDLRRDLTPLPSHLNSAVGHSNREQPVAQRDEIDWSWGGL